MQLQNRTYIISGGSSGLGAATAKLLLTNGAYVAVLDLNPPKDLSPDEQARTFFVATDVSSSESLEKAVRATVQWTQKVSAPLGGVCACAGVGTPGLALPRQSSDVTHETVKYTDMQKFDRVISINLRGTVDLIRLALPHMALNEPYGDDDERGVIIVVSSVAAYEGQVGQFAYSASKGAVASMVLPLARELGQKSGIRVMGIAPGVFMTNMTLPPKEPRSGMTKLQSKSKPKDSGSSSPGFNAEMVQYPMRMGEGHEFARLVKEIVENPMLNGFVIRLDGAARFPSRL